MIQTCCWCLIDGFDETRSFEFPLPQALTTQALTLSLQRARQSGTAFPVPSVPLPLLSFRFFLSGKETRRNNRREGPTGRCST